MNAGPRAYSHLLVGSTLLAMLHGAYAANPTPPSPATKPAAAASAGAATPPCEACHGANGEGMPAAHVPRIAGQSADYLEKQLNDYAEGTCDNLVMTNFAKLLSAAARQIRRAFRVAVCTLCRRIHLNQCSAVGARTSIGVPG
jgi:cytochrome c553